MSVLLRANDGRLSLVGAAKERRILDPTLELLVPGVRADVVWRKKLLALLGSMRSRRLPTMPTTNSFLTVSTPTTRE